MIIERKITIDNLMLDDKLKQSIRKTGLKINKFEFNNTMCSCCLSPVFKYIDHKIKHANIYLCSKQLYVVGNDNDS